MVLVTISCITYNHKPYIRRCLDGFVMQKTNFPFKAIVHDDASTDGTSDIVREYAEKYPEIIVPILEKENVYSKKDGTLDRIMAQACIGKYVAICEGDDYWTDPYKLQKQVDYMEAHPECALCYGNFYKVRNEDYEHPAENTPLYRKQNRELPEGKGQLFYSILKGRVDAQTMTMMYRRSSFEAIAPNIHTFMMGDIPLLLDLSQIGDLHYIDEYLGVYNMHEGSACRNPETRLRFTLSGREMRVYYCEKYGYKVPFYLKWDYNRSYNRMLANDGDVKPAAIYDLFFLNNTLYKKHVEWLKSSEMYRKVYLNLIDPAISIFESFIFRAKRIFT